MMLVFRRGIAACHYRGVRQALMDDDFLAITLGTGGLLLEPRQSLLQVCRRLRVGRTLVRLLARTNEVVNRAGIVSTAAIMIGEVRQVVIDGVNEQGLERLSGTFVQQLAPLEQERIVCHFLSQRMLEDILDFRKCRMLVDELVG